MKKTYMYIIIGSAGREWREWNLISTLWLKGWLFECNLVWVGQYDPPIFILEEELIQY